MKELREQIEAENEMMLLNNQDDEEAKRMKAEIEERRRKALLDGGLSLDEIREEFKLSDDCPYMINISDDPTLAGCLVHYLKESDNVVGSDPNPGIKITGLGIQEKHCRITVDNDEKVTVHPTANNRILINGSLLTKSRTIKHSDRIVFGHGNAWKVMIPKLKTESSESDTSLGYGNVMLDRLNSDTPEARNMKKYLQE